MHKTLAVRQLMVHEGFRSKPYKCQMGKLTIGFGMNLEATPMPVEVAMLWLEMEVDKADKELDKELDFYKDLDEKRKSVLINMAFNLGMEGLLKFKNTLDYVSKNKFTEASVEMLESIWASQVGERANELSEIMEKA